LSNIAAALIVTATVAQPAASDAATRARTAVRTNPVITPLVLQKEALRYIRSSQTEAEGRVLGPKSPHRKAFHDKTNANAKPVVVGIRSGSSAMVRGALVPTIVVSVLAFGLYADDPIPITRRIDYTFNAQNAALITETATVADAATAARFRLPAFTRAGNKK